MEYIEFDESEYLYSDVTELTLQFIADMYGPEVRDKLLVPKVVADVRLPTRDAQHAV